RPRSPGDQMTSLTRRVARAAALTAAVTGLGGVAALAALLAGEVVAARTRRYATPSLGLAVRASLGEPTAPPLRLTLLGDASALGVGVESPRDTLGVQLASLLVLDDSGPGGVRGRRVELSSVAVAGSRSSD